MFSFFSSIRARVRPSLLYPSPISASSRHATRLITLSPNCSFRDGDTKILTFFQFQPCCYYPPPHYARVQIPGSGVDRAALMSAPSEPVYKPFCDESSQYLSPSFSSFFFVSPHISCPGFPSFGFTRQPSRFLNSYFRRRTSFLDLPLSSCILMRSVPTGASSNMRLTVLSFGPGVMLKETLRVGLWKVSVLPITSFLL